MMTKPISNDKSHKEWEAWQDVVRRLKACGAVTEGDCNSRATELQTPGQQLFEAIRVWGQALADLQDK